MDIQVEAENDAPGAESLITTKSTRVSIRRRPTRVLKEIPQQTDIQGVSTNSANSDSANRQTVGFKSINQETTRFVSTKQVGSSFASFMGVVGKHALNGAITVMQKTLQSVPEFRDEWDDDEDDDELIDQWHDAQYDDDDDDDDTEFQDALEQALPRDRIHNICHELMTTEEAYVKRLSILVMAKSRVAKMLGDDVAKSLFRDIEVLHQFHGEYLLPQLQDRLKNWEKFKVIGDIMKKFTPFLKLYTEYVKNFEKAASLVDTWEEKSSKFASFLKEIQDIIPWTSMHLEGYNLQLVDTGKTVVIRLIGMGKSYQLKAESKDNINRWYVMMAGEEVTSEEDSGTS
ncbi:hypothetical protein CAPTEDRAFT_217865 [Capitella teleta]|uniref:DH domain-containing protein n=1 Tax=Capitella teleta TaxID=283909 RepID=R7VGP5_CAPTE|nr:hypothetical protein CAPTEDRAFT_217865 [Capitella teleta]|eukprot:ELU17722.1 hypothetical protein CAPTEDRAFT_217865 [Capitella teleta]